MHRGRNIVVRKDTEILTGRDDYSTFDYETIAVKMTLKYLLSSLEVV